MNLRQSAVAGLTAVVLLAGPTAPARGASLGQAVGSMDTYIAMIDSQVSMDVVKKVLISGYIRGVEDAVEHVETASTRKIETLVRELDGSRYEAALKGSDTETARKVLKVILLSEARLSVDILEAAFEHGDREGVKELMVQFNAAVAGFQGQNYSVGDLMRDAGLLIGRVIGGTTYGVVHTVKVPLYFTVNLVRSLVKNTWRSGRDGFVKVSDKILDGWHNSRIYKGLAGLFDFQKLFEEEAASWRKLRQRYGPPDDPFEDPPPAPPAPPEPPAQPEPPAASTQE